ncbi:PLP-dependent transferase [Christiangramia portivictoriae]|uniref:PLP-dependent transferase n=1 Tax=Christiangramia portivictoriae TaxID=326069 RepID=UPI0003F81434|nr:PLP-dependent transferase [Christiangramia portivictoriae]
MDKSKVTEYIENMLPNIPQDWVKLTTHRLDIYNEEQAKTEFLDKFETLVAKNDHSAEKLAELPTAYDYIRLGHPLSSILEWYVGKLNDLRADHIIAFSSRTTPLLAVLRKNLFEKSKTRIIFSENLPEAFDFDLFRSVYNFEFELLKVEEGDSIPDFEGSSIYITSSANLKNLKIEKNIDFLLSLQQDLGSVIVVNGEKNASYISEIQHVRRRETISMTPADTHTLLQQLVKPSSEENKNFKDDNLKKVVDEVQKITATGSKVLVGSCGLSMQYAIMMGLIDDAMTRHPGKDIRIIVPPNCYGGTNDQARRVAACLDNVEIMDLPVDGDNDMVQSTDKVLDQAAHENAVPLIIAEIPTNPRVEVPDLEKLQEVLAKSRTNANGNAAVDPVFILDQTFCPNVQFCGEDGILSGIRVISYVSGSKFPSGGKCTAGYAVANQKAAALMEKINRHLKICDNEATSLQVEILAEQLPSMNQRIADAYKNTREFVNFIKAELPEAKINFVSEELAKAGFTPSVFSLDLPTKGETAADRESYKRDLNQKLINMMITSIPEESKYCVSYGQLKGCYWTIPATSTQGTTKEDDKDYIARVSVSPKLDLEMHKKVFSLFVEDIK